MMSWEFWSTDNVVTRSLHLEILAIAHWTAKAVFIIVQSVGIKLDIKIIGVRIDRKRGIEKSASQTAQCKARHAAGYPNKLHGDPYEPFHLPLP